MEHLHGSRQLFPFSLDLPILFEKFDFSQLALDTKRRCQSLFVHYMPKKATYRLSS